MSKKIKIGISILLLIIMISVHISYAIGNQNEKDFFKVNKEEISPEETLEMTFDVSYLKYNKFKILLKSNVDSKDIYTENGENVSIENDENAISIDIDKEKIGLNQIKLYYPIPKEIAIGTKIELIAQIIVNNETKEENKRTNTDTNELEVTNNTQNLEDKINRDNTKEEVIAEEITKTIIVVEKEIEDDKNIENTKQSEEKNKNPNENNNEQNSESKISNTEKNNNQNNQSEKISTSNMSNQKIGSNVNSDINNELQATYNGSSNNYLSKLEIEGMELNTSFNKENGTYFVNTDNTNTINVVWEAEDSKAKINIAGNDTIQSGNNKILISVTAENGDVRYYRIFVNCKEGTDET